MSQPLCRAIRLKDYLKIMQLALASANNQKYLQQVEDVEFWNKISKECHGNCIDFMWAFRKKLNWTTISKGPLNIVTATKFKNDLIWSLVSEQLWLSSNFIMTFGDRLNMSSISKNYKNLAIDIQIKYAHKLDWKHVVALNQLRREWFEEPISNFIDFEQISKFKYMGKYVKNNDYMARINLELYMQEASNLSDSFFIYCLREGRVGELKQIAASVNWSEHMLVFDHFPGFAKTLIEDWKCFNEWDYRTAPGAYYIRDLFQCNDFKKNFEKKFILTSYWKHLQEYTIYSINKISVAFNLMLFQNYKTNVDWQQLSLYDGFQNIQHLARTTAANIGINRRESFVDDNILWTGYSRYFKGNNSWRIEYDNWTVPIIPLQMKVKDAYQKYALIHPCASEAEHETEKICTAVWKVNGDGLLNWNLLSSTQPLCPYNLNHLHNVNAVAYKIKNRYFDKTLYKKIIEIQNNM
jgi:hypothetical protein